MQVMPPCVRKLSMIFVMMLSTYIPADVSNPLVRGKPSGLGERAAPVG
jgi:hypothetical protein